MVYGMIAQCVKCGNYEWNKKVEQNKITCPVCGYSWTFRKLPQTIDEYILFQDEEKQADLYLLRQILQQTLPEAEERISWSMPTYRKNPQTIDEYILFQDEEKQADLYLLRQILQQTLPEAEERISWSMPTYRKNHNILHFAAAKKHIGFYPGPEAVEEFREDL